jgi:hypothetical protein
LGPASQKDGNLGLEGGEAEDRVLRKNSGCNPFVEVENLQIQLAGIPAWRFFSVALFKQTQEIEKLAQQFKNCAKA